jgi:hypothetical protein
VEGGWCLCSVIHTLGEASDTVGQEVEGDGGRGEGGVWRVQVVQKEEWREGWKMLGCRKRRYIEAIPKK